MRRAQLNTRFWEDDYIQSLSMDEKAFFLFLRTNPNVNQICVYQISDAMVGFYTQLEKDKIKQYFEKLVADGKVFREGDWVALVNAWKHQYLTGHPNATARLREWGDVPKSLRTKLEEVNPAQFRAWLFEASSENVLKEEIDTKALAEEYGVPVSHVEDSLTKFERHAQSTGRKIRKKLPAFRTWLEKGIELGDVKQSVQFKTWEAMTAFEKQQAIDKIKSGDFTQKWKLPDGIPEKWVNLWNEKWPKAPKE